MSLTEKLHEQHARIAALKASEAELTQGPNAALAVIGPPTDPIRMRATLGILLRADRHQEAADILRDQPPDEKWIDLAALLYASLGQFDKARSMVGRADNSADPALMRLVHLAFAEGIIDYWRRRDSNKALLETRPWSGTDVDLARTTLDILDPILSLVRANQRIDGEFELGAVTYAAYCTHITNDDRLLARCGSWLVRHTPLPIVAAELCLRGLIKENPESLPTRLRLENAGNFHAALLASLMERDLLGRPAEALDSLLELNESAKSDSAKEALCGALFETCGGCDAARIDKAAEVIKKLRPDENRLHGLVQAIKHLVEENATSAKADLDAIRDETDGRWWQIYAQLCQQNGDEDSAQYAWAKASELLPHPDILRRSVKASLDRKKYTSAIAGLLKLLETAPTNAQHLDAIACSYFLIGDLAEARNYFSRLVDAAPTNVEYRMKFAHCLARLAQITEAIQVLEPVCNGQEPPVAAILFQSELLAADNRPADAFRLLEPIAADHWDDPQFLLMYMRQGHASGDDELAHQAFGRLLELRRQGKVPPELMQEGTLEQFLEYGKEYQRRREALQQLVVRGQMPWLFVESVLRQPATWAWELHTQELKWVSEEPLNRAALSIYATNAFTVQSSPSGKKLEAIVAPPRGSEVVADLSALLTLHKLDRLQLVAEYFGRIIIPASYGDIRIREADRFGLHQPSRKIELQKIRAEIDRGRIHVVENPREDLLLVDEYLDAEERHAYRLRDLVQPLLVSQKISSAAIDQLQRIASQPAAADAKHPAPNLGDSIVVDLMTLRTLSDQTVFDPILQWFKVHIEASQREGLIAEINAHEKARAIRATHDSFWNTVANLQSRGKLQWQPLPCDGTHDEQDDDTPPSQYLDSPRLAEHLNKPLLADDRVLQVLVLQRSPASASQAFGSACLLQSLFDSGALSLGEVANDIHRLMQWRYRFIVPSAEVLSEWASQAIDNLPGPDLLDAAMYLHDCLSDPGLLCGFEPTDPPSPMAAKFVNSWMSSIVSFLARIWNDVNLTDNKCISLTRWAGEELIPSCPRGLWYKPIGHNIAQAERKAIFGMALVQFTAVQNPNRANLALRTLAEALGLRGEQYLTAVVEGIHASTMKADVHSKHAEEHLAFSRMMMQDGLFHYVDRGLDPVYVARLRAAGLLKDLSPPQLPANLADILRSPSSPARALVPDGPLVFVLENQTAAVIEVAPLLLHPDQGLRSAAVAYFQSGISLPRQWLTTETRDLLSKCQDDILSEPEEQWRDAAINLVNAVRRDLFALLAAFRQSVACRYQEGIDQYLEAIIHPLFETLANVRPPLWSPNEQRDEIPKWISEAAVLPDLEMALTQYLDKWGYVPLCADLSAPRVVKSWLEQHPDSKSGWNELWAWATKMPTPVAKYHALAVALHIPAMRTKESVEQFWEELVSALDLHEGANNTWHVFCELASHFARHIEALHPGQNGERIACYAWWLADKVGRLVGTYEARAKQFEETILGPALQFSSFRWTLSRSPVVPSSFRHATLNARSVWAMSLLAQLSLVATSFQAHGIPQPLRARVSKVLRGYLLLSNLADKCESSVPTFAFEENFTLNDLCLIEGYMPEDMRNALTEMIDLRRQLSEPTELQARLDRLLELPGNEQHLTLVVLKAVLHATAKCDSIVDAWLNQTKLVVDFLCTGAEFAVGLLLEVLSEFQQRPMTTWPSRLPHLLAYAIEQTDDLARASFLSTSLLQMSTNGGVLSPILRVVASNKLQDWRSAIGAWRDDLAEVAKYSEPWVAARIRAVSATISRILGPRTVSEPKKRPLEIQGD
jgi:predicted Zn-dependent protease